MAALIVTLMVLSLTSNMVPEVNVIAIVLLFFLYFFRTRNSIEYRGLTPHTAIHFLIGAYVFWTFSYLLTKAPISNFFSYEFLRLDGAVLIGYLPLLLLRDCGLSPRIVSRLVWAYLGILAAVGLLGALQFLAQIEGLDYDAVASGLHLNVLYRSLLTTDVFHGWYRAHNAAGSIYAMAACIALALTLGRSKISAFSWPALIFAATLTGMVISQSRSSYIGFLAAFFVVFVRTKKYTKALLRIGILVVVPVLGFWLSQSLISRRVQWMTNLEDPNVLERFDYYTRAVGDFLDSPVIGIGFGRYNDDRETFSGTRHFVYIATQGQVVNLDDHAHDSYLHFLAEGGVVGLFLMAGIWVATYRWARRLRNLFGQNSQVGVLAQAVQACIVVVFFFSLTEHAMGMALSPLTVFTMVGLLRNLAAYEARRIGAGSQTSVGTTQVSGAQALVLRPREAQ
jgi:O-antigen ligase